ncbi:MAG: hypothetical protein ACJ76Y_10925 [Thermoanaerobaculia bacterium]
MRRTPPWALLPLLLAAAALRAAPPSPPAPALEAAREGVTLSRLPPILGEEEVRKQLGTGLTTSFAFEATARRTAGGKLTGAARVDVRYDLWDEIYIVTRVDASGHAARVTLPSFERLAEWWRDARLVLIRGPATGAATVEVRLKVIPFSQAEQLETQRWFSQALSAEKSGSAGAVSDAVEDQPESFSQVINLLMATSIGRPSLLEYAWKLPVAQGKKR